jgi:serine-type D-Ala-D-Ala carboxypeptidase (penicillin-binding protein 5/6)
VPLDVLTPVTRRRRRRRFRAARVVLVLLVVFAVAGGAIWFGRRAEAKTPRHAAAWRQHATIPAKTQPRTQSTRTVSDRSPKPPPRLLHGKPLLAGAHVRVRAPAAILVDAGTGRVLWAERPHQRRKIASLTKIMTATLALHEVPWHSRVTVAHSVTEVPLVREGLRTGERVEAWKLFYALLLYSGNDDANQLAISSAGSVHGFLRQMNDEAQRLGLRDTHYTSPSGVRDHGNYSTPWDLAALTRYAFRNARFDRLVQTRRKQVRWSAPTNSKIYLNNNALLSEYTGANGVKTGYTHESGWCLVASATRHGRRLIAVVLDSPNIYADARRLLNLGFSRG